MNYELPPRHSHIFGDAEQTYATCFFCSTADAFSYGQLYGNPVIWDTVGELRVFLKRSSDANTAISDNTHKPLT